MDSWLFTAADATKADPELSRALHDIAAYDDSRKCLLLLGEIVRVPGLVGSSLSGFAARLRSNGSGFSGPSSHCVNGARKPGREIVMTLSTFYLICFVVGFSLTALSFFFGALHIHLPIRCWHIPVFSHHAGSVLPHGAGAHGASGAAASAHGPAAIEGAGKPARCIDRVA